MWIFKEFSYMWGFLIPQSLPQTTRDMNSQTSFIRDTLVGKVGDTFNLYKFYLNLLFICKRCTQNIQMLFLIYSLLLPAFSTVNTQRLFTDIYLVPRVWTVSSSKECLAVIVQRIVGSVQAKDTKNVQPGKQDSVYVVQHRWWNSMANQK